MTRIARAAENGGGMALPGSDFFRRSQECAIKDKGWREGSHARRAKP
jgi:hypothetical protein